MVTAGVALLTAGSFSVSAPPVSAYCDPEMGPCLYQYGETVVCTVQHAKDYKNLVHHFSNCATHPTS